MGSVLYFNTVITSCTLGLSQFSFSFFLVFFDKFINYNNNILIILIIDFIHIYLKQMGEPEHYTHMSG